MQATQHPPCALTQCWQRLRMHVACGLSADQPNPVRLYLQLGLKIARSGTLPAASVHLRMLQTLLQASQDEGLPGHWRSVCLEHATSPLGLARPAARRSRSSRMAGGGGGRANRARPHAGYTGRRVCHRPSRPLNRIGPAIPPTLRDTLEVLAFIAVVLLIWFAIPIPSGAALAG